MSSLCLVCEFAYVIGLLILELTLNKRYTNMCFYNLFICIIEP